MGRALWVVTLSGTSGLLFSGCLHVGTPPSAAAWVVQVEAPVAEPDLDRALKGVLEAELRARGAWGGPIAVVRVVQADWVPERRLDEVLVYAARLAVEVDTGSQQRRFSATTSRGGLGDGAGASRAREEAFLALAQELGVVAAAWLAAGG